VEKKEETSDSSSCRVNNKYLNTPQKIKKISSLRERSRKAESKLKKLTEKVKRLLDQGEEVDQQVHSDMVGVMKEQSPVVYNQFPEGSFARIFWDQQLSNAQKKSPQQYRWHPLVIKWCLNMKLMSSCSYHAMRTAGFVTLRSERTLRDYTNYIKTAPGIQSEVLQQMRIEAKIDDLPESKRYVTLMLDEMSIKEDLVFQKHSCIMIGFVHLGSINDHLLRIEQEKDKPHPPIANHVLVIMVRGLFFKFEFPLAHYPTRGCSGEMLYPIVWDAIKAVESAGLKVIAITADGASCNRRFFRMHSRSTETDLIYKTRNIYAAEERSIFFISDPPHLVKTIRNCWSHSFGGKSTREMFVS